MAVKKEWFPGGFGAVVRAIQQYEAVWGRHDAALVRVFTDNRTADLSDRVALDSDFRFRLAAKELLAASDDLAKRSEQRPPTTHAAATCSMPWSSGARTSSTCCGSISAGIRGRSPMSTIPTTPVSERPRAPSSRTGAAVEQLSPEAPPCACPAFHDCHPGIRRGAPGPRLRLDSTAPSRPRPLGLRVRRPGVRPRRPPDGQRPGLRRLFHAFPPRGAPSFPRRVRGRRPRGHPGLHGLVLGRPDGQSSSF